jgi:L-threonylcarbamoyladenylate synthase
MTNKNHTHVLRWDDPTAIHALQSSLTNDRVSIVSTDTILGFLARPTKSGYDQLHRIKGSREAKPYLILIGCVEKLKNFVDSDALHPRLLHMLQKCWPGPVTVIFPVGTHVASFLCAENKTIGLRCPAHKGLQQLLPKFDGLLSTSANFSGQPVWRSVDQIPPAVLTGIDHIVIDQNVQASEHPSTIIDASLSSLHDEIPVIRVVREGAYAIKDLEKLYGQPFER